MFVIRLFCQAGLSTSHLVKKMKEAAEERGLDVSIEAYPESDITNRLENVDVALIGPQVRFRLDKIKTICDDHGVPVDVIPMVDYGMLNGDKVLNFALNLTK